MSDRSREYTLLERGRVGPAQVGRLLRDLEETSDTVWLDRKTRCARRALAGVPMGRIDVLVDERILAGAPTDPRDVYVAEVGRKAGRYDGAERPRLALRIMRGCDARHLCALDLRIDVEPGDARRPERVSVTLGAWSGAWDRLRMELDPDAGAQRRIIAWHWTRYYAHLPHADVADLLETWAPPEGASLASSNRSASRALYERAREVGWSKLTLRERRRLGYDDDHPQWVRTEEAGERRALRAGLSPSGASEHTLAAARGDADARIDAHRSARAAIDLWEAGAL